MLLIARELGGIRLGKRMIPLLLKGSFTWLGRILRMIKGYQTPNMGLRCQVKMAGSLWLYLGSVEPLLVPLKKHINSLKLIQNAPSNKECFLMIPQPKLWINFNLKNFQSLKRQDGVDSGHWSYLKITKVRKTFRELMLFKSQTQDYYH